MPGSFKRKPNDTTGKNEEPSEVKKICVEQDQSNNNCFSGFNMLICYSGMGNTRADLFKRQLTKFGATVSSTLSPEVSYLIIDESVSCERVCNIFKLSLEESASYSLDLVIIKTTWLSACFKEKTIVPKDRYEIKWKEYLQKQKQMAQPVATKCDEETISKDKEDPKNKFPKVGVMWKATNKQKRPTDDCNSSNGDSDYAASDGGGNAEFSDSGDEDPQPSTSKPRVAQDKWICAQSSANKRENVNEYITKKLQELATIYENTKDTWRALGYQKAIAALRRHPKPITSFEEAKALRGVGARIAEKIWEIVESGELRKLDELSSNEDLKILDMFTKLWGAGPTTASAWVRAGFRTLDDLRTKANLTRQQKIGLKYYDELLDRMPRAEATEIEATVKQAAEAINPGLVCMACGSYRRGRPNCGDVDVLITHPDGKSHRGVFSKLLNSLRKCGFLTDDLVTQEENGNQKKYLGVCLLPGENQKHRRLDIIVVPYDEFACALMYFTGSAHFNRSMRHLAGKMGMSLSEHSLNKGVVKVNGQKINPGIPLPTLTEESVFEHLGLKHRPPEDRDHQ